MKTILMTVLLACVLFAGACSRSDKQPETTATTTPSQDLKLEADRLQRATADAAEERKRTAPPDVSPTASAPQL